MFFAYLCIPCRSVTDLLNLALIPLVRIKCVTTRKKRRSSKHTTQDLLWFSTQSGMPTSTTEKQRFFIAKKTLYNSLHLTQCPPLLRPYLGFPTQRQYIEKPRNPNPTIIRSLPRTCNRLIP